MKSIPQRKLHRLPMSVYSYTGHEFHFTICSRHQGEPFRNRKLASAVIESLLWTKKRYKWWLFCYCLMPDHLHFVCRLTDAHCRRVNAGIRGIQPESVLDHIARFKSYTTSRSWEFGFKGRLWQKSSYDRVLDLEQPLEEVLQYVLENPVRKELVKQWDDWEFSSMIDSWH